MLSTSIQQLVPGSYQTRGNKIFAPSEIAPTKLKMAAAYAIEQGRGLNQYLTQTVSEQAQAFHWLRDSSDLQQLLLGFAPIKVKGRTFGQIFSLPPRISEGSYLTITYTSQPDSAGVHLSIRWHSKVHDFKYLPCMVLERHSAGKADGAEAGKEILLYLPRYGELELRLATAAPGRISAWLDSPGEPEPQQFYLPANVIKGEAPYFWINEQVWQDYCVAGFPGLQPTDGAKLQAALERAKHWPLVPSRNGFEVLAALYQAMNQPTSWPDFPEQHLTGDITTTIKKQLILNGNARRQIALLEALEKINRPLAAEVVTHWRGHSQVPLVLEVLPRLERLLRGFWRRPDSEAAVAVVSEVSNSGVGGIAPGELERKAAALAAAAPVSPAEAALLWHQSEELLRALACYLHRRRTSSGDGPFDHGVNRQATELLKLIKSRRVYQQLLKRMQVEGCEVQALVGIAQILKEHRNFSPAELKLAGLTEAVPPVTAFYHDAKTNPEARRLCAEILIDLDAREAFGRDLGQLLPCIMKGFNQRGWDLSEHPYAAFCLNPENFLEQLANLFRQTSMPGVGQLQQELTLPASSCRWAAAWLLGKLGPQAASAAPVLAEIAAREHGRDALFAMIALGRADFRAGASLYPEIDYRAKAGRIMAMEFRTLLAACQPLAPKHAALLLPLLNNPFHSSGVDALVNQSTVADLGTISAPNLMRFYLNEAHGDVDEIIVQALTSLGKAAVAPISVVLRSTGVRMFLVAKRALQALGPVALSELRELAQAGEDRLVQHCAQEVLRHYGIRA